MAKSKTSANNNQVKAETHETTLEKRVLNSNLSDEDKIILIQLIGGHPNVISIPSVWTPDLQPLNPTYRKHPEYAVTCSAGNDSCPHVSVSCLDDGRYGGGL
jgi:hypothetical protein